MRRFASMVCLLVSMGCGSDEPAVVSESGWEFTGYTANPDHHFPDFSNLEGRWDGHFPADCAGTTGASAFACTEQHFWQALTFDHASRREVSAIYDATIARLEASGEIDPLRLGMMYFRRGHLATALSTENRYIEGGGVPSFFADFDRALQLVPSDSFVHPMIDSFDLSIDAVLPYVAPIELGSREEADEKLTLLREMSRGDAAGLFLFVTSAAGLPLESGWPEQAREALDEYEALCPNHECATTTSRAPFAVPGSDWVFADVYARLGDRERAIALYDRALAYPGTENWPARDGLLAERAALDERMADYAEAGETQSPFMAMSSNGPFACVMCHQPASSRGLPAPFED
jgi:tetratricopeptide (TPR) repeat protein